MFHTEYAWIFHGHLSSLQSATAFGVTAAAFLTLAVPRDARTLASLAALQLVDVAVSLPEVPNHWLITALVNLTLLGFYVGASLRHRALQKNGEEILAGARSSLQLGIVLFYAFAFLWKLNHDFVRPETSCAAHGLGRIADWLRLGNVTAFRAATIWTTLLVEGMAPLLLLLPRTRRFAVVGLVVFHGILGLDIIAAYLNFSAVMFAFLVLFVPPADLARAGHWAPRPRTVRIWMLLWVLLIAFTAFVPEEKAARVVYAFFRWIVFWPHAALVIGLVVAAARNRTDARVAIEWPRTWAAWIFPLLVLLIGFGPLAGIRNRGAWQMYSNLRLEPTTSNHFVFPRSLDLLGLLADRVDIVAVSDAGLRARYVGTDLGLTWMRFRTVMAYKPNVSVRYRRGGHEYAVARVGDDPVLSSPPPWPARALFFFRPLGPGVVNQCAW